MDPCFGRRKKHSHLTSSNPQVPGYDKSVPAIVASPSYDGNFAVIARARPACQKILDSVGSTPARVFHQHHTSDAEFLYRDPVDTSNFSASKRFHTTPLKSYPLSVKAKTAATHHRNTMNIMMILPSEIQV